MTDDAQFLSVGSTVRVLEAHGKYVCVFFSFLLLEKLESCVFVPAYSATSLH